MTSDPLVTQSCTAPYPASLGCCGASTKDDCTNPPCPCNLDCWTEQEKRNIQARKRKAAA